MWNLKCFFLGVALNRFHFDLVVVVYYADLKSIIYVRFYDLKMSFLNAPENQQLKIILKITTLRNPKIEISENRLTLFVLKPV